MTSTKAIIPLTLVALCACRPATTTTRAPDTSGLQEADLVIHAARVFVGDGSVREAVTVAIDGGKIVAIEPSAQGEWSGREEIDAGSGTLLPGLIDTHVHLVDVKPILENHNDAQRHGRAHRSRTLPCRPCREQC